MQADVDVFGMGTLDIAAHGVADSLAPWHDCRNMKE